MAANRIGGSACHGAAPATCLPACPPTCMKRSEALVVTAPALASGGCLTSEAGGGRNPSPAATIYICITQSFHPPPHPVLSSDSGLEMRVGLPSEASSCRWSAQGPRDPPERRRNGLAHVVRARFSLHHFCFF